jgi:hypothetical protein
LRTTWRIGSCPALRANQHAVRVDFEAATNQDAARGKFQSPAGRGAAKSDRPQRPKRWRYAGRARKPDACWQNPVAHTPWRPGHTHRRIGAVLQRFGKQADRLIQALAQNYLFIGALLQTPALH